MAGVAAAVSAATTASATAAAAAAGGGGPAPSPQVRFFFLSFCFLRFYFVCFFVKYIYGFMYMSQKLYSTSNPLFLLLVLSVKATEEYHCVILQ